MKEFKITGFSDFCEELLKAGFSMGGGNDEGIYAVVPFSWNNKPDNTNIQWHTGERETDPWEWRIRVLDEREDIAYAKLFMNKSGYITKEWYPCFLAVRRKGKSFADAYADGEVSHFGKRIYDLISQHGVLPLDVIKKLGGFSKEDKSAFDRAVTELQMKMFITICGRQQKTAKTGEEYGWASTAFCRVEDFFEKSVFDKAAKLSQDEAALKIKEQILKLSPDAQEKKIKKFIG